MKILWGTVASISLIAFSFSTPSARASAVPNVIIASYPMQVSTGTDVTITGKVPSEPSDMLYTLWLKKGQAPWHQRGPWGTANTFHFAPQSMGENLFQVDAISKSAYQHHDWAKTLYSLPSPLLVGETASLVTSSSRIPEKNSLTLTATASGLINPTYQFWYETPSGSWVSSGAYSPNSSYTFTASQMGVYHAIVDVLPSGISKAGAIVQSAIVNVQSYGAPRTLSISTNRSLWVADGKETGTLTVRVLDAKGDQVADYNGSGSMTDVTGNGALGTWGSTPTNVFMEASIGLQFDAGVATIPMVAGDTAATASLIARVGLSTGASLTGTGTITAVPQVATGVAISPTSPYLIANESGNPASYAISVVDQVGEPLLSGTETLTATIQGPAQFHDLTQGPDTVTYTGGKAAIQEMVYSMAGGLGPVTLHVSGPGLKAGSAQLSAILGGQPYQMGVTATTSSLSLEGTTTLTLTQLTKDGGVSDPASLDNSGYVVTLTNSHGDEATGFTLGGIPYEGDPITIPVALGPNFFYAVSQPLTLEDIGAEPGTYTLIVSDADGLWKASKALTLMVTN